MPQIQLPIFPQGSHEITREIAFSCEGEKVTYWNGHLPVFIHEREDVTSFRLFTSQLIINGTVRQVDIVRTFGVPLVTVKRYVKVYRQEGPKGFFKERRRRSASVLKGEVRERVQELLDEGKSVPEVGRQLGILPNTLHKAIRAGRLHRGVKKTLLPEKR